MIMRLLKVGSNSGTRLSIGLRIAVWFSFSLTFLFLAKHELHAHK